MSIFQISLTYILSWWVVLFMVLPMQAEPPAQPGAGHAPSAPENPRLGKKFLWTSMLAIIPTLALYLLFASHAFAVGEDPMLHAGTGCTPRGSHAAADSISTHDGGGAAGKKVVPATIGSNPFGKDDKITVGLDVPAANFGQAGAANGNPAAAQGNYLELGKVSVGSDGSAELDGHDLKATGGDGCDVEAK